jgi:membrane-anchored protein YejM (alkaline phosphatase superfamily)
MQRTARKGQWTNRFDEIDRDKQLKQVLDTLENENSMLKTLVVRLSETIIRNAIAKR